MHNSVGSAFTDGKEYAWTVYLQVFQRQMVSTVLHAHCRCLGKRIMLLIVSVLSDAKIGDRVEIAFPDSFVLAAAFITFILPFLLAFAVSRR